MEGAFRWGTTLGVGSALFLFAGFVYLAIGLATPFALGGRRRIDRDGDFSPV